MRLTIISASRVGMPGRWLVDHDMATHAESHHELPEVPRGMTVWQRMMCLFCGSAALRTVGMGIEEEAIPFLPAVRPCSPLLRAPCLGIAHLFFLSSVVTNHPLPCPPTQTVMQSLALAGDPAHV